MISRSSKEHGGVEECVAYSHLCLSIGKPISENLAFKPMNCILTIFMGFGYKVVRETLLEKKLPAAKQCGTITHHFEPLGEIYIHSTE